MSSFEIAGHTMLRLQEGNRSAAAALASLYKRIVTQGPATEPLLGSKTFYQQEPDLAKETHLPGTYLGSF